MGYDFSAQRQQLMTQLQHSGIHDPRVLHALTTVPREQFVDTSLHTMAYANQALPLLLGQTISQPLMVAVMTQALHLTGNERVLEVGTGSGYQAAILSLLAAQVYSIERHVQLSLQAAEHLKSLGYLNVELLVGDGSLGWPEHAPYDRIIVTAAAPYAPAQLLAQLHFGGSLVIPIGDQTLQDLQIIQKVEGGTQTYSLGRCVFVPLVGEDAWQ
ncbi:protein-L-isoaspartate(D-aspartate) O-methyltransferase [Dictyobacter arantiisoli]|uniref:Protein-L-isoaspartate O-methyltransferase n=1 Tax=Dictyobacter arantiisoli TaxID=2014874 RepID=A0A5A5TB30_9CHLR|nr:protein-L-isoaspartate(D-aspartate) O-methyltransferase [Dictyobacter arantiisoli]GCF08608.1 protein-L-isoaspartate O-methyltransferase [Dictyobacter arantiisoli]